MTAIAPCRDCGIETLAEEWGEHSEYYMVHDAVWAQAGMAPGGGYLCVGCLEQRLGRRLNPGDFPAVPLNDPGLPSTPRFAWSYRTPRLQERLSGQGRLFP